MPLCFPEADRKQGENLPDREWKISVVWYRAKNNVTTITAPGDGAWEGPSRSLNTVFLV